MRVGTIASGRLGLRRTLVVDPRVDEVLYYNPSANARAIAERVGAAVCESVEELLRRRPAGVVIATPAGEHREVALEALRAGAAVMFEDSPGATLAEAVDIVRTAASLGLSVTLACEQITAAAGVLSRIEGGEIGPPAFVDFTWRLRTDVDDLMLQVGHQVVALALAVAGWTLPRAISVIRQDSLHLISMQFDGLLAFARLESSAVSLVEEDVRVDVTGKTAQLKLGLRTSRTPRQVDHRARVIEKAGAQRGAVRLLEPVSSVEAARVRQTQTWIGALTGGASDSLITGERVLLIRSVWDAVLRSRGNVWHPGMYVVPANVDDLRGIEEE